MALLVELRGFQRITLAPGDARTVHFTLVRRDLEYLDEKLQPVLEPGDVSVMVGSSSADIRCSGIFTIPATE